jgi:hypothetical protein
MVKTQNDKMNDLTQEQQKELNRISKELENEKTPE